ncbi:hypothetical protein [Ruminiclostridium cellobioparum]|uniref:hypothetical protein n=1 Tax=Ruminiclostridium cellobioparum TaxID=29355 RepID=UPI000483C6B6|nr:hypothetical protein [Ruminiclostridium cellobioparum]
MSKKNRTNIEINNDRLIIWQYITGPLFYVVGGIVIMGIVIGGINFIWRSADNDTQDEKEKSKITEFRQEQVDRYIDHNEDYFGTIEKSYWDGSTYHLKSDKGDFAINFVNNEIFNIEMTNKANQTVEVYRKK